MKDGWGWASGGPPPDLLLSAVCLHLPGVELLLQPGCSVHQPAQFTAGEPDFCQEEEGPGQVRTHTGEDPPHPDADSNQCKPVRHHQAGGVSRFTSPLVLTPGPHTELQELWLLSGTEWQQCVSWSEGQTSCLCCRYGDMRVRMTHQLFSMWQNLGEMLTEAS